MGLLQLCDLPPLSDWVRCWLLSAQSLRQLSVRLGKALQDADLSSNYHSKRVEFFYLTQTKLCHTKRVFTQTWIGICWYKARIGLS